MSERASDGKRRVYRASTGKGTEDWTMDTVQAQRGYHAGPGAAADHESRVAVAVAVAVARGPVAGGVQAGPGAANGFRWLAVVSCTKESAGKSAIARVYGALVGGYPAACAMHALVGGIRSVVQAVPQLTVLMVLKVQSASPTVPVVQDIRAAASLD